MDMNDERDYAEERYNDDLLHPSCPNVPRRDGTFSTEHESGFYCDVCGDITV
jgi:hypothetical protein